MCSISNCSFDLSNMACFRPSRQKQVYNRRTVRTALSPTITTTGGQSEPCQLGMEIYVKFSSSNYASSLCNGQILMLRPWHDTRYVFLSFLVLPFYLWRWWTALSVFVWGHPNLWLSMQALFLPRCWKKLSHSLRDRSLLMTWTKKSNPLRAYLKNERLPLREYQKKVTPPHTAKPNTASAMPLRQEWITKNS